MKIKSLIPVIIGVVVVVAIIYGICYKYKDTFLFEVSKPKLCQGYPYMQSSAPKELRDYCDKLMSTQEGRDLYASMNCTCDGFNGRPVAFAYTPESNASWENTRCNVFENGVGILDHPPVL